jgi:WD40 repeat protein
MAMLILLLNVWTASGLLCSGGLVGCAPPTALKQPSAGERLFGFVRFANEPESSASSGWAGLVAIDPKTGTWTKFMEGGFETRVSSDGAKLALNRIQERALYICDSADSKSLRKIKDIDQAFQIVGFSPDGSEILILSAKKGGTSPAIEHWRVKADGSAATILPLPEGHVALDWSANGNVLLTFLRSAGGGGQLYLVRLDGTIERRLTTDGDNAFARFSPDGKRIAYLHRLDTMAGRPVDVWTVDRDGNNNRPVFVSTTTKTGRLSWSPDGLALALVILDLKKEAPNPRPVVIDLSGKVIRTIQMPAREMLLLGDWCK